MGRLAGAEERPAFVVVDKPENCTSFDVVRSIRRCSGYRRVGHGGTLDPFATGVLVVALGPATRLLKYFSAGDKVYHATLQFGWETDSEDLTGAPLGEAPVDFDRVDLEAVLERMTGSIEQVPPRLSALKVDGRRSYQRARAGEEFELAPRTVEVHALEILEFDLPRVSLRVQCGGGTYVRSLARDVGRALGSAAHLVALRREAVGPFDLADAHSLQSCVEAWDEARCTLDPEALLRGWTSLPLDPEQSRSVGHGGQPEVEWWTQAGLEFSGGPDALLDDQGRLLAIAVADEAGLPRLDWVRPLRQKDEGVDG